MHYAASPEHTALLSQTCSVQPLAIEDVAKGVVEGNIETLTDVDIASTTKQVPTVRMMQAMQRPM